MPPRTTTVVCIVSALAALAPANPAAGAEPTPRDTIEEFVRGQYWTRWEDGESGPERINALLARVRADPGVYTPLLLAELDFAKVRADEKGFGLHRAGRAAWVLVEAGGEAGRAAVAARTLAALDDDARFWKMSDDRVRTLTREQRSAESSAAGRVRSLAHGVVSAFANADDPRLVDGIVTRLGATDTSTRQTLYDYLRRVARGDVAVADRLEALWSAPSSPIRVDPQLTRTIILIRNTAPPASPPATPAARVDRLLRVASFPPLSSADAATMRAAAAEPEAHLAALDDALGGFDPAALRGVEAQVRFQSAAALLGQLDVPAAAERLGTWYARLDAASRDRALTNHRGSLLHLRDVVLDALGSRPSAPATGHIMASLLQLDKSGRAYAKGYLLDCCRDDAAVAIGLARLRADPRVQLTDPDFDLFYLNFTAKRTHP